MGHSLQAFWTGVNRGTEATKIVNRKVSVRPSRRCDKAVTPAFTSGFLGM